MLSLHFQLNVRGNFYMDSISETSLALQLHNRFLLFSLLLEAFGWRWGESELLVKIIPCKNMMFGYLYTLGEFLQVGQRPSNRTGKWIKVSV